MKIPKAPRVRFPFGVRGGVFSIMVIGLSGAMITAFTGAVFTDTATATSNTFVAGTLDLKFNTNDDSESALFQFAPMAPGDGQIVRIPIKNAGNLPLRYSLSVSPATFAVSSITETGGVTATISTGAIKHGLKAGDMVTFSNTLSATLNAPGALAVATVPSDTTFTVADTTVETLGAGGIFTRSTYGALYPELKWKVAQIGAGGTCTATASEPQGTSTHWVVDNPTSAYILTSTGTANDTDQLGSPSTDGGTGYVSLPTGPGGIVFGDPAQGAQGGERTLAANGGSEVLCIKVILPVSVAGTPTSGFQGANAAFDLTFNAEQTDNNP